LPTTEGRKELKLPPRLSGFEIKVRRHINGVWWATASGPAITPVTASGLSELQALKSLHKATNLKVKEAIQIKIDNLDNLFPFLLKRQPLPKTKSDKSKTDSDNDNMVLPFEEI
jgi:hypothetical protein